MNNNENNENLYHDDNSFNNQGVVDAPNTNTPVEQTQFPSANRNNAITNFGKGLAQGIKGGLNGNNGMPGVNRNNNNNPAKGQKKPNNSGLSNNNNNNNNNNDKTGKGGQNNSAGNNKDINSNNGNRNPLPGGGTNKKDDRRDKIPKKDNKNDAVKKAAKAHPAGRAASIASRLGLGKNKNKESGNKGAVGNTLNEAGKQGIRKLWTILPIQAKIAVVTAIPLLLIMFLIMAALFGGTTAATIASMCETDGSTYNGAGYTGSADLLDFACSAQHPLAYKGLITSWSGPRWGRQHEGVDIGVANGSGVYAAQAGTVTTAGREGGYGNSVVIAHTDKISTRYGHNSKLLVKVGDKVGKGQKIALSGNTGNSTGPHLHFEFLYNGKRQYDLVNNYFGVEEKNGKKQVSSSIGENFKKQCGASWDGELAGDSANVENDTSDVNISSSTSSDSECCVTSSTSSSSESVKGLPAILTQEFVDGAIATQTKYKVPASVTLAQIVQESRGTYPGHLSGLAYNCNNLFGIKGSGSYGSCVYSTKEETSSGNSYTTYASFRKYKNKKESIEDHGKFLVENSRYSDCFGKTSDEFARCIKKAGYATDADYADKLISIMKDYNLYQYDDYTSSDTCVIGGDGFSGKIWEYYQNRFSNSYCGVGTIASSGCGPTAMAMAVSSLLNEKHDPVELAKFSCNNGYRDPGNGTTWNFFAAAGKKYGLNVQQLDTSKKSQNEVKAALNTGKKLVVVSVGKSVFTKGGHFILLTSYKNGDVFVQDPNEANDSKLFSFDKILVPASRQYWIVSKG